MTDPIAKILDLARHIEDEIDIARQVATERDRRDLQNARERLLDAAEWVKGIEKEIGQ